MRGVLYYAVAAVVTATLTVLTVAQPIIGGGLIAAVALLAITWALPERHLVAVTGSASIAMVMLFPIHLVESAARYAELLVIAVFALVILMRRRSVNVRPAGPLLLAGYLVITIASSIQFGVSDSVFQVLTSHMVVALAFLVMGVKSTRDERRILVATLIVVAASQAAYGMMEVLAKPPVLWASPVPSTFAWSESRLANEIVPGMLRAQGSFGHPLLFVFVLLVALAFTRDFPFKQPGMRGLLTVLFFVGAIAAGSRSAVLIMVAVLLFSIGSRRFRVLRGIGVGMVGLAFIAVTGFFESEVVNRFVQSGSLTHRQGIWNSTPFLLTQPFDKQLIGNGWIRVEDVYALQILPPTDGFKAIDNQFIATFITSGWAGLTLLIAAIVVSLIRGRGPVRLALLTTVGVFFVFDVLEFPATWSLLTLVIGFASTTSGGDITRAERPLRTGAAAPAPVPALR